MYLFQIRDACLPALEKQLRDTVNYHQRQLIESIRGGYRNNGYGEACCRRAWGVGGGGTSRAN